MLQPSSAIQRLSTEGAFAVLGRAAELASQGRSIINLGIGQPDFHPPAHVMEAANKAMIDGHHGYTAPGGIPDLRQAIAAQTSEKFAFDCDPSRVLVVPGGKMTISFAVLMFGEPGSEILYPDPGFPIYRSMIDYSGAKAVAIPHRESNGFAFAAEEVLERITDRTRLIILNSPSNPTGGVTPKSEIDALVKGLLEYPKVAILSDEIYSRMVYGNEGHSSLMAYPEIRDRVILLDGWSKTFAMTGWRLGFGVWPTSLAENVERLAVNFHSCVNAVAQFAGLAALTGPQDAVDAMVAAFDQRRARVVEALNDLPGVRAANPGGAFYAFPNITGTGIDDKTLALRLLEEAGIATIAGRDFGDQGQGFLRVSYANSLENIDAAMQRMGDFLADHGTN